MNSYEIKERLKSYKWDISRLNILSARIKDSWTDGMKGQCYDGDKLSESFNYHSITEDSALSNMEKYNKLIREHCRYELRVNELKYALESLTDTERRLIALKYIDKQAWHDMGEELKYSKENCQKMHRAIVEHLTWILQ